MISRTCRVILPLVLSVVAVGCDKLPLLAPTASTITLFAGSNTVQANGSIQITATVLESSGTPVQNGTLVSFVTTVGQINPSEARTQNGQVSVTFLGSGQSGEAQIQAISGGAKLTAPLTIKVGGAAASRIQLNANPGTVPPSGGSSQITATVTDASGNALASIPVSFSTDAGTLSSAVVATDASGQAVTTLTTNREAKVTATAGGTSTGTSTSAASGTVTVKVAVLPTLSITPPTGTVTARVSANFTVTASTPTGASPFQNVTISFGDGSSQSLGALTGSVTVPHIYNSSGTYIVSVEGTDITGAAVPAVSTSVTVAARLQPTVSIAVTGTPAVGSATTFTVTANPAANSGAIIQEVRVDFGDGSSVGLGATTGSVSVQHVYQSAGTFTATVTARDSNGGNASASTVVVVAPQQPLAVNVTTTQSPSGGNTTITFTATVTPASTAVASYAWNFGDGTSATTTGNVTNHVYTAGSGVKTVTLTVTATNGQTGSATISVVP